MEFFQLIYSFCLPAFIGDSFMPLVSDSLLPEKIDTSEAL